MLLLLVPSASMPNTSISRGLSDSSLRVGRAWRARRPHRQPAARPNPRPRLRPLRQSGWAVASRGSTPRTPERRDLDGPGSARIVGQQNESGRREPVPEALAGGPRQTPSQSATITSGSSASPPITQIFVRRAQERLQACARHRRSGCDQDANHAASPAPPSRTTTSRCTRGRRAETAARERPW